MLKAKANQIKYTVTRGKNKNKKIEKKVGMRQTKTTETREV